MAFAVLGLSPIVPPFAPAKPWTLQSQGCGVDGRNPSGLNLIPTPTLFGGHTVLLVWIGVVSGIRLQWPAVLLSSRAVRTYPVHPNAPLEEFSLKLKESRRTAAEAG